MAKSKNQGEGPTCPKCGSKNIQIVSETHSKGKTKGFGIGKSCLGWLIFGFPGLLCGLCGMGKGKTKSSTISKRMCVDCGKKF